MINLNNKNITYVALADSNNSVKGVKEIWYADSSNSVKLVYRRKDALIEGEDYEKYHWLVSNSEDSKAPYIDTLIPPDLKQYISFSFKVIDSNHNGGEPGVWGAVLPTSWLNCVIRCYKNASYNYIILEYNNNNDDFPNKENMIIKTEFSEGREYNCSLTINNSTTALGAINGESKSLVANSNVSFVLNPQPTHVLFVQNTNTKWSFNSVGFKKFNIFNITNLISLVPCKLLKPVPKWLDANGIRRQVGECGMIDLVSGKFYGNVNSVGTFTVENYYERKEWLQGRNGAYIDTRYVPIPSEDSFKFKINNNGFWGNPNEDDPHVFGTYSPRIRFGTFASLPKNRYFFQYSNVTAGSAPYFTSPDYIQEVTLLNDGTKTKCIANGIENEYETTITEQFNDSIWLYAINNVPSKYFHGDIAYFKITDTSSNTKMNLIPCTLTMDLPASMDANNIARTKGTSGMWDLVSDKFYGNVANSGTFKAVNLAEGVDYEVHQWIIGDNVAYIDGLDYNLWQNTLQIQIGKVDGNCQYFGLNILYNSQTRNGSFFQLMSSGGIFKTYFRDRINEQGWVGWFNLNNMPSVVAFEYYIEDNKAVAIVNGVKTYDTVSSNTLTESVWNKYVPLNTKDGNNIYTKLAKVSYIRELLPNGTYRSNLIPVKLLRSIPSKYDANGIARQAGECGMYDTVNDVFYGNVALSGSFTVEDDN